MLSAIDVESHSQGILVRILWSRENREGKGDGFGSTRVIAQGFQVQIAEWIKDFIRKRDTVTGR